MKAFRCEWIDWTGVDRPGNLGTSRVRYRDARIFQCFVITVPRISLVGECVGCIGSPLVMSLNHLDIFQGVFAGGTTYSVART